jgi:hypothetical protein
MSYAEWQQEQKKRAGFASAGVPYKSPSELREEAADMRQAARESAFSGDRK